MKHFTVLGNPSKHSLSPKIHNFLMDKYGINGTYGISEISKGQLQGFVRRSLKCLDGFNVTIPYKQDVVDFCGSVEEHAKRIGAVTCVVNKDGILYGHNTDYLGFILPLKDREVEFTDKTAIIIGAGGAARAIFYGLAAAGVKEIIVYNRSYDNALKMVNGLSQYFSGLQTEIIPLTNSINLDDWWGTDIIVNATSMGLNGTNSVRLSGSLSGVTAVDVVYSPLETSFLKEAKSLGATTFNGLHMLSGLAALSFELWHDIKPEWREIYDMLTENV